MASSNNGVTAPAGSNENPFAALADESKGKGKAAAADDTPMGEDAEDDDDDDEEEATEAEEVSFVYMQRNNQNTRKPRLTHK